MHKKTFVQYAHIYTHVQAHIYPYMWASHPYACVQWQVCVYWVCMYVYVWVNICPSTYICIPLSMYACKLNHTHHTAIWAPRLSLGQNMIFRGSKGNIFLCVDLDPKIFSSPPSIRKSHTKHVRSWRDFTEKLSIPWICLSCQPSHCLHLFFLTPFSSTSLSLRSHPSAFACPTCDSLRIVAVVWVCP